MPAGPGLALRRGEGMESGEEDGWIWNCLQFTGLRGSCCCTSPRNDTTTSGAEIHLSQQEKDKTNHPLQESHSGPVGKSPGMNGFCEDHSSTWIFPLCSVFLQVEVYKVWGGGNLGVVLAVQEMLLHTKHLGAAGVGRVEAG